MAKGYKKEYIEKVKFHDLQPNIKDVANVAGKPRNDKDGKEHNTNGVAAKR